MKKVLVCLGVLSLFLCKTHLSVASDTTRELFSEAQLDTFVTRKMREYQVPGAAVVVIKGDQRMVRSYGVRKSGTDEPVGLHTQFAIASVSKALTADLAVIAADHGVLDLTAPVINYLPELVLSDRRTTEQVTMRNLLSHSTGFPAFSGDLLGSLGYSHEEVLRRLRHFELETSLGTEAAYSNPGIFLAGLTAGRTLGASSYQHALTQYLFEPLDMNGANFYSGPITPESNIAYPHLMVDGKLQAFEQIRYTEGLAPASSVVLTITDLANWLEMHVGKGEFRGQRVISEEGLAGQGERVILEHPGFSEAPPISTISGFAYGQVWGIFPFRGYKVLEKGGARSGYRAVVISVPEADLAIGVLSNLGLTVFPEAVRAWVMERVLDKDPRENLQTSIFELQGQIDQIFEGLNEPPPTSWPNPDLPLYYYTGLFKSPLYGTIRIRKTGDNLTWSLGPLGYGGPVIPLGGNDFALYHPPGVLSFPEEATFTLDADGFPAAIETASFGSFVRK